MKPLIIGIDPGKSGGVCEIHPDGKVDAFAMPDEPDIRDYLGTIASRASLDESNTRDNLVHVYLEQVGGFIGKPQPGSSMFVFGSGYGFIRGLLSANYLKYFLVRPQTWSKGIPSVQGTKGPDRKRALKEHAARLYPNLKVTLSTADAILIANYGRQQEPQ